MRRKGKEGIKDNLMVAGLSGRKDSVTDCDDEEREKKVRIR